MFSQLSDSIILFYKGENDFQMIQDVNGIERFCFLIYAIMNGTNHKYI